MDFDFTPEAQAFRREVRSWLAAHLPPDLKGTFTFSRADPERVERLRAWQRTLYEGGWVGLNWPVTYGGRGVSIVEQVIFYAELARAAAPPPIDDPMIRQKLVALLIQEKCLLRAGTSEILENIPGERVLSLPKD